MHFEFEMIETQEDLTEVVENTEWDMNSDERVESMGYGDGDFTKVGDLFRVDFFDDQLFRVINRKTDIVLISTKNSRFWLRIWPQSLRSNGK